MTQIQLTDSLKKSLDDFKVELPSWGFADTGTRFGKFLQPAAASTIEEKIQDAALVHQLTGASPTIAVHVLWDFNDSNDPKSVAKLASDQGISIGAINPNYFQDQHYKYGSAASPWKHARQAAHEHTLKSIEIARAVGSKVLSLWFADGINYPGQDDLISRKRRMEEALINWHSALDDDMTMLVEYKPFEPAFYATDIADWGMACLYAQKAGPKAKVLVDTGHHLQGTNIEQIVGWLLDENMLGGFHFNDRKYADDDLTLGSIDPYAVFRIFHEIRNSHELHGKAIGNISYMIDQCHNLKPKIEAMLQTVLTAQELYLKACLVDRKKLQAAQQKADIVASEELLRSAFFTNVKPILNEWRTAHNLPEDPLKTFRESGYESKMAALRTAARKDRGESTGGGSFV